MMKTLNAMLASLALAIPATSQALDIYAFARGGAAYTAVKGTEAVNPFIALPAAPSDNNPATFQGSMGIANLNNDHSVAVGAFGAGFVVNPNFRLELEGSFQKESDYQIDVSLGWQAESGPFKTTLLGTAHNRISIESEVYLLKAYYDFPLNKHLVPYVMAGTGYAKNKASGVQNFSDNANWNEKWDDHSSNEMAWTVGLGLSYIFSKHLALDLGVEHRNLGDWELKNMPTTGDESIKGKLESTTLLMGLRYHF
ncbi:outer membrane protein [Endozoicomonas sp. SESOKO1]|uniref:outer membrane protein n=1 Tax=Endozoicomonas sp. SESOKO1 TaxID=2828742 RepID=UPI002147C284|nr:outer membrane beta-barrel protein [Endozoicomonas sp. SESOKO1]